MFASAVVAAGRIFASAGLERERFIVGRVGAPRLLSLARATRCSRTVTPYMVVGCMMVSSGVETFGVDSPNTAMVEGEYTRSECSRASSSTCWMPAVLILSASCGLRSPTADSRLARCTTESMPFSSMTRASES